MRELLGYHGEHRRHAGDAHALADNPATRAHDSSKHAAQDARKLRMLLDPEARKAARLAYQQKVEATEAEYAARHARPKPGEQSQAAERLRPKESEPDRTPLETRDVPASKIAGRWERPAEQEPKQRKPERSRLPKNDTAQLVAGYGVAIASLADAADLLPDRWDKVAASFVAAAVATVVWANRRWKDKHGHRPDD